jgi:hypothetical protein
MEADRMTDTSTESLQRLLDGVTPGPWRACETTIHGRKYGGLWIEGPEIDDGDGMPRGMGIPISGSGGSMSYTTRLVDRQSHDHNDANARFIAAARDLVPALLAERDAALARANEAEAAINRAGALAIQRASHAFIIAALAEGVNNG